MAQEIRAYCNAGAGCTEHCGAFVFGSEINADRVQRQKTRASIVNRKQLRSLPRRDDPRGIPRAVMKDLAQLGLSNDRETYNVKLQQLLKEAENV